jgi:hypothetical protein
MIDEAAITQACEKKNPENGRTRRKARVYLPASYLDPARIENATLAAGAAGARGSGKRKKKQKKKRGTGAMSSSRPHSQMRCSVRSFVRLFVRSFVRYAPLN